MIIIKINIISYWSLAMVMIKMLFGGQFYKICKIDFKKTKTDSIFGG